MAVRLKADGATGKVAIYTGTDDLPFDTPLSYVSRLRFHSDLEYPRVISTHTGTVSLPAVGAATGYRLVTHTLFAHGLGGAPFVEGTLALGGVNVPWLGSVPAATSASGPARWLHLGADATNIICREYSYGPRSNTFGALSVNWTVYLTDTIP